MTQETRGLHYDWLAHFDTWFASQFGTENEDEGILRLRSDMIALFASDEAYWSNHSYWQLHDSVCSMKGGL